MVLMVVASEHLAKRTFAEMRRDFVPVGNVASYVGDVLVFVIIKAIVLDPIWWLEQFLHLLHIGVDPVHYFEIKDFLLFEFKKEFGVVHDSSSGIHRKLEVAGCFDGTVSQFARDLRKANGFFRIAEDSLAVVDHCLVWVISPVDAQVFGPGCDFVYHCLAL